MKKLTLAIALMATFTAFSTTTFAGDIEAGKARAMVCSACHGQSGISVMPMYPNLAGQNEAYLVSALKAYKDKNRNGGMAAIMQGQAASLSDTDMADLAAYFASL